MDDAILTKRLCALLGGITGWAWRPTGPKYTASDVAVFYGALAESPDRAVGVRVYLATDDVDEQWASRRVQLHFRGARGAPASADELADEALPTLQRLSRVGGISGIRRVSMAPLGADQNGREERSDNYEILLDNPEAYPS